MCSALGWEATVRHNHIECEAAWHVPVVMQPSQVHGEEETAKLQFVVNKFVFQLPLKGGLDKHRILRGKVLDTFFGKVPKKYKKHKVLTCSPRFRMSLRNAPHPTVEASSGKAKMTLAPEH